MTERHCSEWPELEGLAGDPLDASGGAARLALWPEASRGPRCSPWGLRDGAGLAWPTENRRLAPAPRRPTGALALSPEPPRPACPGSRAVPGPRPRCPSRRQLCARVCAPAWRGRDSDTAPDRRQRGKPAACRRQACCFPFRGVHCCSSALPHVLPSAPVGDRGPAQLRGPSLSLGGQARTHAGPTGQALILAAPRELGLQGVNADSGAGILQVVQDVRRLREGRGRHFLCSL